VSCESNLFGEEQSLQSSKAAKQQSSKAEKQAKQQIKQSSKAAKLQSHKTAKPHPEQFEPSPKAGQGQPKKSRNPRSSPSKKRPDVMFSVALPGPHLQWSLALLALVLPRCIRLAHIMFPIKSSI
jgi:hypothetical protein